MRNNSYNERIKQSPYEDMFGYKMKMGFCNINILSHIPPNSQEDLEKVLSKDTQTVEEDFTDLLAFVNETHNNPAMNPNDKLTFIGQIGLVPDAFENKIETTSFMEEESQFQKNAT